MRRKADFQPLHRAIWSLTTAIAVAIAIGFPGTSTAQQTEIVRSDGYGGTGGHAFDDWPESSSVPLDPITSIVVRHGGLIDSIATSYGGGAPQKHGGNGGSQDTLTLMDGEHIIGVNGRAGRYVDGLTFVTNMGRQLTYGGSGGHPFEIQPPPGGDWVVRAFHGGSGGLLDRIGVYWGKIVEPTTGYRFLEGSCRGEGWSANGWPKNQGYQSPDGCKSRCDETDGCTAFDLARPQGDQFDCYLFGHRQVVGAGGPDRCFHKYVEMTGACRGDGWNTGGWPQGQGYLTQNECQARCDSTAGCTSFDVARPNGDKFDCYLFGHQGVVGAPDPTAICHTTTPGYFEMQGACRGDGWNTGGWPKGQGYLSHADCQTRCDATTGCTSYDIARPQGDTFDCYLFGHNAVIGAPDPTAICYSSRPE